MGTLLSPLELLILLSQSEVSRSHKNLVVKGVSYNLLIGIDFMNSTHAFIDFGNKTLFAMI